MSLTSTLQDYRRKGETLTCPHCTETVEKVSPQQTSTCAKPECRRAQDRLMYAKRKRGKA